MRPSSKPVALQLQSEINCEDWKRLQDLRILTGGASLTCTHGKRQTKSQYNAVCEVSTALPTCHRSRQSKEIKRLTFKTKEKLFTEIKAEWNHGQLIARDPREAVNEAYSQ